MLNDSHIIIKLHSGKFGVTVQFSGHLAKYPFYYLYHIIMISLFTFI